MLQHLLNLPVPEIDGAFQLTNGQPVALFQSSENVLHPLLLGKCGSSKVIMYLFVFVARHHDSDRMADAASGASDLLVIRHD